MTHRKKALSKRLKSLLLIGSISLFQGQAQAGEPEPAPPPAELSDELRAAYQVAWGISHLEGDWAKMLYLGAPTKDGTAEKCAFPVVLIDSEEACNHYNCINTIFLNKEPVEKLTAYGQRGIFVVNCDSAKVGVKKPDLLLDDNGKRLETNIFYFYPSTTGPNMWEQGKKGKNYVIELFKDSSESRLVYTKGKYIWEEYGIP